MFKVNVPEHQNSILKLFLKGHQFQIITQKHYLALLLILLFFWWNKCSFAEHKISFTKAFSNTVISLRRKTLDFLI